MKKVFISYSRDDFAFVDKLCHQLHKSQISYWIDRRDIQAGEDWSRAIDRGLELCDLMILIMSPSSITSKQVESEWKYFHSKHKPIIQIRMDPSIKGHHEINTLQNIDLDNSNYQAVFDKLAHAISGALLNTNASQQTTSETGAHPDLGKTLPTAPIDEGILKRVVRDDTIRFNHVPTLRILTVRRHQPVMEISLENRKRYYMGRRDGNYLPEIDLTRFDAYKLGVSRKHVCVRRYGRYVYITELGATNPTLINDRLLQFRERCLVQSGDKLQVGKLVLQLFLVSP